MPIFIILHTQHIFLHTQHLFAMKAFRHIIPGHLPAAMALLLLSACSGSHPAVIERMVEDLNSPEFRAAELETGLFTGSEAKTDGDELLLTFVCRPSIDLSVVDAGSLPQLKKSAIEEFRSHLGNQSFKRGIEALGHEKMSIRLVWQDARGHSVSVSLSPDEVLGR